MSADAAPPNLAHPTPPEPPFAVGAFGSWNGDKYRLDWCPFCELDPDRSSTPFDPRRHAGVRVSEHVFAPRSEEGHREELLELLGGAVEADGQPARDREQRELDQFGGGDRQ